MQDLSYYEALPDFMDGEELKKEFEALMKANIKENIDNFLESIYELSLRQVASHSPIDELISTQISDIVISLWDMDSLENTETSMGIIINLELYDAYQYFKTKLKTIKNKSVKIELEDAFAELGNWGNNK